MVELDAKTCIGRLAMLFLHFCKVLAASIKTTTQTALGSTWIIELLCSMGLATGLAVVSMVRTNYFPSRPFIPINICRS